MVHSGSDQETGATDTRRPTSRSDPISVHARNQAEGVVGYTLSVLSKVKHGGESRDVE